MIMLTTNNPYHKTVAQYGGDHNEGEGQGPEHVQVAPARGRDPRFVAKIYLLNIRSLVPGS